MTLNRYPVNLNGFGASAMPHEAAKPFLEGLLSELNLKNLLPYAQQQKVDVDATTFGSMTPLEAKKKMEVGVQLLDSFLSCTPAKKIFEEVLASLNDWAQLIFAFDKHQAGAATNMPASRVFSYTNGSIEISLDLSPGAGYQQQHLLQLLKNSLEIDLTGLVGQEGVSRERWVELRERISHRNAVDVSNTFNSCRKKWDLSAYLFRKVKGDMEVSPNFTLFFVFQNFLGHADLYRQEWQAKHSEKYCKKSTLSKEEFEGSCKDSKDKFVNLLDANKKEVKERQMKHQKELKNWFLDAKDLNKECFYSKELCASLRKLFDGYSDFTSFFRENFNKLQPV